MKHFKTRNFQAIGYTGNYCTTCMLTLRGGDERTVSEVLPTINTVNDRVNLQYTAVASLDNVLSRSIAIAIEDKAGLQPVKTALNGMTVQPAPEEPEIRPKSTTLPAGVSLQSGEVIPVGSIVNGIDAEGMVLFDVC